MVGKFYLILVQGYILIPYLGFKWKEGKSFVGHGRKIVFCTYRFHQTPGDVVIVLPCWLVFSGKNWCARHLANLVITSGNGLALISFHALMTKVVTYGIWMGNSTDPTMGNWNRNTRNFQSSRNSRAGYPARAQFVGA